MVDFTRYDDKIYSKELKMTKDLIDYAAEGNLKKVKELVTKGADVHAESDLALCLASSEGHLETVKFLVSNGANVHAQSDLALRWASSNGHLETVKFLVSNGADVHAQSDEALRWASLNGHKEVVEFLKSVMNKKSTKKPSKVWVIVDAEGSFWSAFKTREGARICVSDNIGVVDGLKVVKATITF